MDTDPLDDPLFSVYTINKAFEWDNVKARRNALKHGISFEMAMCAFDDPRACTVDDLKHSTQEARRWLIGDSESGVLVVVFTLRPAERNIRIISARKAKRKERRIYEKNRGI
jgi:uncharacterized DUF497 family protein